MTTRPVPARRPWFMMPARLMRVPGWSPSYHERTSVTRDPMFLPPFVRELSKIEILGDGYVVGAADEDRRALVVVGRLDVQDSLGSRACLPARLLREHAHGRYLVEEAELGLGLGGIAHVGGIHEDAAVEQGAVHVRHHGPGIAQGVGPAARLVGGAQELHEGALTRVPGRDVALVDAVDLPLLRHPDVGMREEELPVPPIHGEAVRPLARR